jgi:hypothetical protein
MLQKLCKNVELCQKMTSPLALMMMMPCLQEANVSCVLNMEQKKFSCILRQNSRLDALVPNDHVCSIVACLAAAIA